MSGKLVNLSVSALRASDGGYKWKFVFGNLVEYVFDGGGIGEKFAIRSVEPIMHQTTAIAMRGRHVRDEIQNLDFAVYHLGYGNLLAVEHLAVILLLDA